MPANLLKCLLGFLLGILSFLGFLVNLLVLVPVFRFAFVQNKSPIYLLSFINIIIDMANLLMTTFYLAPTIILDSYLNEDSKAGGFSKAMGSLFMFFWYLGSITQMVMAVNRLVVIHFRRNDIFIRKNIGYLYSAIIPLCTMLMYLAQYHFPCCAFVFDHMVLSYSYNQIDDLDNYPNRFIDLPLNITSTSTALVSYSVIVWTVRKSKSSTSVAITSRKQKRNREFSYALQFSAISMFYTFSWIGFRVLPMIIGNGNGRLEWFVTISIAVVINNSANALVYLASNREVQQYLKTSGLIFKMFPRASSTQTSRDLPPLPPPRAPRAP